MYTCKPSQGLFDKKSNLGELYLINRCLYHFFINATTHIFYFILTLSNKHKDESHIL